MSEFLLSEKMEGWDKIDVVKFNSFCCNKLVYLLDDHSVEILSLMDKYLEDESIVKENYFEEATLKYSNEIVNYDVYDELYLFRRFSRFAIINYTNSIRFGWNSYNIYSVGWVARALKSSRETLYIEYVRSKLSDIMEG